ncbi:hypothetical protein [Streptomyces sp. NPDC059991]|uniref:hypothetical protein n=1 Tax=unclassified Streptomyces TaxID=2593676 RepID=UPI0036AE6A53
MTIAGIAADAGVSTAFIYKHPALRPQVESLRRSRTGRVPAQDRLADADAAESTLIRRLTQQLAQIRKEHREQITELRSALEAAHGGFIHGLWFWLNFCDAATLRNEVGRTVPAG